MTKLEEAENVIGKIRKQTSECVLFCSLGKDSLVTLDLVAGRFDRVLCVFMYFVKGLEHIDKWARWVQVRYPNVEFVQVPHWNLTYILRGGLYCVPNPKIKLLKLADVVKAVRAKYGLYYCFLGMKKADGMNRRLMLNTYAEAGYENNGFVYPLANWTQREILAYMRQHNLPSPVRYGKNASNGVGFNEDCFLWMRKNYPQDLAKVIKAFPMSERILWEYDMNNK